MLKKINSLITAVVLIAILVTSLVSFQAIARYNDASNRQYLLSAGLVIRQKLVAGIGAKQAGQETLEAFNQEDLALRITLVDRAGNVLYDNEADHTEMDSHQFRSEIALAFKTEDVGWAVRRSDTLNQEMIYVAQFEPELDWVVRTSMPVHHSKEALRELIFSISLVMLITLVVLLVSSMLMTRWISRPLHELKNMAVAIADGAYHVRFHRIIQEDNEVHVLGEALNTMADRLEKTIQDLAERNDRLDVILNAMTDPIMVVREDGTVSFMNAEAKSVFGRSLDPESTVYPLIFVTRHEAAEQWVKKAIADNQTVESEVTIGSGSEARIFLAVTSPLHTGGPAKGAILTLHDITEMRRSQKVRSDFVANVTHELKTPLTSIRGFVETLRTGAYRKPEIAERFLEFIDIESERLHQLIQDILTLSEIEDQEHETNAQTFDLSALLDAVAVLLDEAAEEARVSLIVDAPPEPLLVKANPDRIKQILINLVDNAIKYNKPGGKVTIGAKRQPDHRVRLVVSDTGMGIHPDQQKRIFERFYRVDKSRSRDQGGTGLGLSIVKHIAQLYHGYATVESQPGEGSIFTVVLDI